MFEVIFYCQRCGWVEKSALLFLLNWSNFVRFDKVHEAELHQVEEPVQDVMGGLEAAHKLSIVSLLLVKDLAIFELGEVEIVIEVAGPDRPILVLHERVDEESDNAEEP